jgi:hypothetical protein
MLRLLYRRNSPHSTRIANRHNMKQCYRQNTCDSKLRRQSSNSNSNTTYKSRQPNIRPRNCRLPSRPHSCRKRRRSGKPHPDPFHLLVITLTVRFRSSNNPFATDNLFGQPTTPSPVPTPQLPPLTSPAPSDTSTPALVQGRPASSASVSSRASSLPPRTPISARAPDALSAVLASAGPGGVDTFGNVGSLRYGSSAFGRAAQRTTAAP